MNVTKCKKCNAEIFWASTKFGKWIALEPNMITVGEGGVDEAFTSHGACLKDVGDRGFPCHFNNCNEANAGTNRIATRNSTDTAKSNYIRFSHQDVTDLLDKGGSLVQSRYRKIRAVFYGKKCAIPGEEGMIGVGANQIILEISEGKYAKMDEWLFEHLFQVTENENQPDKEATDPDTPSADAGEDKPDLWDANDS